MAFFQHPGSDISPLFNLLDGYAVHRSRCPKNQLTPVRSFVPKFDVRQIDNGYQLDGELPGVNQNNIEIEFTDPHTLVIKGRTERDYTTDSNVTDQQVEDTPDDASSTKSFQPFVEDEDEDEASASTPAPAPTEVPEKSAAKKKSSPAYKYWASERSIGEFYRTFEFPTRVDQDLVRASLRNGILSVIVPNEPAPKLKKIRVA